MVGVAPAESLDEQLSKLVVGATASPGKQVDAGVPKLGVLPAFAPVRATLEPRVREAYERAAARAAIAWPRCGFRWTVLAAIGAVESANGAHVSGAVVLSGSGRVLPPIIGPALDSTVAGTVAIHDTDGGVFDGDAVWDHAVGPMQFLPSTWARMGLDGNGDGRADPHSIDDAALTAAAYLCAGARDLTSPGDLDAAIYSYNHSDAYVATVRGQLTEFDDAFGFTPAHADPRALALEQSQPPVASAQGQPSPSTSTTTSTVPTSTSTLPTTSVAPVTTTTRSIPVVTTTSVAPPRTPTTTAVTTTTTFA
jgi:hypothetical protein